ncbi:MAG: hypothetical protein U0514_02715 [Candidatus Andersenbacteria bacterium]
MVGVVALLLVGGGIALVVVLMQPKPQPIPLNAANGPASNVSNIENEAANVANQATDDANVTAGDTLGVYMEGTGMIVDDINAALQNWNGAADFRFQR